MNDDSDISSSGILTNGLSAVSQEIHAREEMPSDGFNQLQKVQRHGKWYVLKGLKGEYRQQPFYTGLLRKEFDLGIRLNHPNIAQTVDFLDDTELGSCILMEYVDGRTLKQYLSEPRNNGQRRTIVAELLDAIRYYQSLQIVHRDLKPSNILITHNGNHVKLIDFGLSDSDQYAILKQPAGSPCYASPEQQKPGTPVDGRSDQYAFGLMLRQLFPRRYRHIARRCCRHDREKRYAHAEALANAIRRADRLRRALLVLLPAVIILSALLYASALQLHTAAPPAQESAETLAPPAVLPPDVPLPEEETDAAPSDKARHTESINAISDAIFPPLERRLAQGSIASKDEALAELNHAYWQATDKAYKACPGLDRQSRQWGEYSDLVMNILYYRHFQQLCHAVDAQQLPTLSELYESRLITKPTLDSLQHRCDSLQQRASEYMSRCQVR